MEMIVINFKTYKQGKQALKLAKIIEKVNKNIIVCVQETDIYEIAKTKLKVYSQHVDYYEKGRYTGYILPEAIKKNKAKGSLLNHSEHPVNFNVIKKTIKRCNKLDLKLIVCSATLNQVRKIKKLKPYAIAFEDPKLIATKRSISKYKAGDVKKFVDILKRSKIIPLCGAGIHSKDDIKEAKKLGCKGVLIASAVAKSKNPGKVLKELL